MPGGRKQCATFSQDQTEEQDAQGAASGGSPGLILAF